MCTSVETLQENCGLEVLWSFSWGTNMTTTVQQQNMSCLTSYLVLVPIYWPQRIEDWVGTKCHICVCLFLSDMLPLMFFIVSIFVSFAALWLDWLKDEKDNVARTELFQRAINDYACKYTQLTIYSYLHSHSKMNNYRTSIKPAFQQLPYITCSKQ